MPNQNLTPIPIPARERWRDFRVFWLPPLTFMLLVTVIGWMWVRYVAPATIIGEVETVRTRIASIVPGTIQELKVDRLESVTNGQELVVVTMLDADQVAAELTAVEADLRLMQARMNLDKTRNLDSYSRLRVQLQLEQLNLDLARIRLQQAEGELARTKKLLDDQIIARGPGATRNDFGYDVALRDRDLLRAEITAREKSVSELQTGVRRLEAAGAAREEPADTAIEQAIVAQREKVQRLEKPIVLRSPINGFVSVINHLPGSKITAGETILVVSAEKSTRILAWVRQPVTERPQVGDIVEVRRSILGQPAFETTILKVGRQLEQINPTAVTLNDALQRAEFGLPLIVHVPEKLDLIPGETVQMHVIKRAFSTGKGPD